MRESDVPVLKGLRGLPDERSATAASTAGGDVWRRRRLEAFSPLIDGSRLLQSYRAGDPYPPGSRRGRGRHPGGPSLEPGRAGVSLRDTSRFDAWFDRILVNVCRKPAAPREDDPRRGPRRRLRVARPPTLTGPRWLGWHSSRLSPADGRSANHRLLRFWRDLPIEGNAIGSAFDGHSEIPSSLRAEDVTQRHRVIRGGAAMSGRDPETEQAVREWPVSSPEPCPRPRSGNRSRTSLPSLPGRARPWSGYRRPPAPFSRPPRRGGSGPGSRCLPVRTSWAAV